MLMCADVSCKTQMLAQAQGHGGEGGAAGGLAAFAAKLQGSSHKQGTCLCFFLPALLLFFVVVVIQHILDMQNTTGYAKCDATQLAGIMSLANLTGDSRGMQTQSHSGKPQDRLMGQLERRAEAISGDINA